MKRDARPDDAKYVAIARAERPLPARGVHFFEVPQLFYLVPFPHLTLPSFHPFALSTAVSALLD